MPPGTAQSTSCCSAGERQQLQQQMWLMLRQEKNLMQSGWTQRFGCSAAGMHTPHDAREWAHVWLGQMLSCRASWHTKSGAAGCCALALQGLCRPVCCTVQCIVLVAVTVTTWWVVIVTRKTAVTSGPSVGSFVTCKTLSQVAQVMVSSVACKTAHGAPFQDALKGQLAPGFVARKGLSWC